MSDAVLLPATADRPSRYEQSRATGRAGECRERDQVVRLDGAVAVDDRERRAEAGAGRDAEQVRVGERVAEDALVGRAGEREHAADEQPEHDARRAKLPEDRAVASARDASWMCRNGRCERPSATIAPSPRCTGPISSPTSIDPTRKSAPQTIGSARRPGKTLSRPPPTVFARVTAITTSRRRSSHPAATARMKSTIRGPQREAMSSFTRDHASVL